MGDIRVAVNWAVGIARDDTHGYDQEYRNGPNYDCSSLVGTALNLGGYNVSASSTTRDLESQLRACGFFNCTAPWSIGDIHLKTGVHVCMSISATDIVEASSNEYGTATGGQTGDQTGTEIWTHAYYEFSGGWDVHLRAPDAPTTYQWHAKPSGGYSQGSVEYFDNIKAFNQYCSPNGWSREAIAGALGNVYAESGLNPWLWQNNSYNLNLGYGLFQFTPASDYINGMSSVPNYAPNLSTSQQTAGADPNDAMAQIYVLQNDLLGKWNGSCWRSYWDANTYPDLYALHTRVLNEYGNGTSITFAQFMTITDLDLATFAFLACYEGPAVPNYSTRYQYAQDIYPFVDNGGGVTTRKHMPLYMFLRRRY